MMAGPKGPITWDMGIGAEDLGALMLESTPTGIRVWVGGRDLGQLPRGELERFMEEAGAKCATCGKLIDGEEARCPRISCGRALRLRRAGLNGSEWAVECPEHGVIPPGEWPDHV